MSAADRRLDELRARRAARTAARAAFEERRRYGLQARHTAKLAYLAVKAATEAEERMPEEPENSTPPEQGPEPEAA